MLHLALEFGGLDVTLIPAMPAQISRLLLQGQADAAVWTVDEMQVRRPEGILDRPLKPAVREQIGDRMTRAVLVGRAVDAATLRAVTASIEQSAVAAIENDVLAGRVVPEFNSIDSQPYDPFRVCCSLFANVQHIFGQTASIGARRRRADRGLRVGQARQVPLQTEGERKEDVEGRSARS